MNVWGHAFTGCAATADCPRIDIKRDTPHFLYHSKFAARSRQKVNDVGVLQREQQRALLCSTRYKYKILDLTVLYLMKSKCQPIVELDRLRADFLKLCTWLQFIFRQVWCSQYGVSELVRLSKRLEISSIFCLSPMEKCVIYNAAY